MKKLAVLSITVCYIRKNFDTNKYPNIFVSTNLHERMFEYIRIKNLTRTNVRINIRIENLINIRRYSNIHIVFTLLHTHERISEDIRTNKFDMNKCPNIFVSK